MLVLYLVALLIALLVVKASKTSKFLHLYSLTKASFPCIPIIGHGYKLIGNNEDRMLFFEEINRQAYKNKYGIVSMWALNEFFVSISDPAAAGAVLRACSDKGPSALLAKHLLGNGSVFGDEEIWRLRRRILTRIFASKYYNSFVQVFERNIATLMTRLAAVVGEKDVSMWKYFSSFSLDSALDMTFGESAKARKQHNYRFVEAYNDYIKNGAARLCQPWLYCTALYRLLPAGARQRRNRRVMWQFVQTLILKTKEEMSKNLKKQINNQNTLETKSRTLLELLIESSGGEDAGYSDTELREESLVLLLAATDTTATAACFTIVLLANHPEVQDRLYEEVRSVLRNSDRRVTGQDIASLIYLDAVVKESMRLYTPAPLTARRLNKDIQLPSGLVLREGCQVLVNFWGVHRNPEAWGPDANQFRPERFLTATPDQLAAFMPFGHRPRNCIGMRLAMASLKLSLAELLRRYRVAPALGYQYSAQQPLRVTYDVMLKHVHDFKVQLRNRC